MKTKALFLLSLVIFSFLGCKTLKETDLEVIDFTACFNFNVEQGLPNFEETSLTKIIKYQNAKVYIVPQYNTRVGAEPANGGERVITHDTTYTYLFVEEGKKIGLKFDSLSATVCKKFDVDSLMDRINISKKHLVSNGRTKGKLAYIAYDKASGKVAIEKLTNNNEFDSTYRYYDYSLKDLDFSIAPELDKTSGSKLVKLVDVKTAKKDEKGVLHNREEVWLAVKRGTYKNTEAIIKLFQIFKTESKRLNIN